MIDPQLKGKVVCITGGNNPQGIGAATARAFASQGASVFIHYFRQASTLSDQGKGEVESSRPGEALYLDAQTRSAAEVIRAIRREGGQAESWEADLGEPSAIPQLFDRVEQAFGPVEVLINNAALDLPDTFIPSKSSAQGDRSLGGLGSPMGTLTGESHDRHFAVNCRAPALMMAEFTRRHVARGGQWGRIVNVSTDGASGFAGEISYGASKHALESYSQAAARELAPYGITVNVVSLGPIQTDWISPELEEKVVPTIPLGRLGSPEDVADVIVFLSSEQARWLTGQLLYVGGGHTMPL
ncbi:MAG: SDR family oxidoreductase [Terriglobia bacterium]|jgi:3-oxoacyl-[acyl-carrier protein] reductase